MSAATLNALIAHCRALCRPRSQASDTELVRRFARERDTAAFEELLERYAPMVWGVCRRILRREADCEDAFQATFLALVRKPDSIDPGQSLGAWLHTVAVRIALKAIARSRRQHREAVLAERRTGGDVADEVCSRELFRMVDEEIERLPPSLREPLVLCCLQGRTRDEAADALGYSVMVIKGRLERGRDLLRKRLERRGVELPAAFLVLGLTGERIRAALWAKTMNTALCTPAPSLIALAEAGLSTVMKGKCKLLLAALLLVSSAAGAAATLLTLTSLSSSPSGEMDESVDTEEKKPETPQARMDRQGDPLPEGALARLGTVRFRHGAGVLSVAFSPDGKMVTAGGAGRTISLWDAATGKELRRFPSHRGQPSRVAFSPDGNILASVSPANSLVCLYEANTGKELRLLQGHQSGVCCAAFSPDGIFLASGDIKGTVRLWKPDVGNPLPKPPSQPDEEVRHVNGDWGDLHAMTFSPDGKILAFAGEDGKIRLWNARAGDEMRRLNGHPKAVLSLAFSPDGKHLASAGADKTIRLWAMATGEQVRVVAEKADMVLCVVFAPDARLIASACRDGTLALCDPHTGRVIREWQGHSFAASSVAFSPHGKQLVSGAAWDSSLRLWDVNTGNDLQACVFHRASVNLVRWLPGGKSLLSIDRSNRIIWWNLAREYPQREVVHRALSWSAFALSDDGVTLATGGFLQDNSVRVGTITPYNPGRLIGKHEKLIQLMALSPDGRLLAAGRRDEALRLWDVRAGKEVRQFEGPGKIVGCLAFSPDSRMLAYGVNRIGNDADDKTLRLMDVTNSKEIHTFTSRTQACCVVFSPDGKVIASWHCRYPDKSYVCLWDVASGKELCRHSGHPAGSGVISFSPDGKLVTSTGWIDVEERDPHIDLWEAATGQLIRRFVGHHSGVNSLAFSPDGLKLASGGGDSTILLWDITGRAGGTPALRSVSVPPAQSLTSRGLDNCWAALANEDAAKAYDAVWTLAAAPEQAVPFLRKKLPPLPLSNTKRIARLIADLDSDVFNVRELATKELSKLSMVAAPALRQTLENKPSAEMRRRIQQLLDHSWDWTPERLREHRVLKALEHLGSPSAREMLQELASGMPGTSRTEEAKAALQRIALLSTPQKSP
jgi:RNA polymerase sigma factor (sigma-70 family)